MDGYCGLRRSQLRAMSVLAFVACIWTPSLALANNNAGLRTIPLHISNHINQAVDLYVLIFGQIKPRQWPRLPCR
jgi:hypothetical protein